MKRKHMYQKFICIQYGKVGKNICIPISPFIQNQIRNKFPDKDNKYMGFKYKWWNNKWYIYIYIYIYWKNDFIRYIYNYIWLDICLISYKELYIKIIFIYNNIKKNLKMELYHQHYLITHMITLLLLVEKNVS